MIKDIFYLSYKPTTPKGVLISFLLYIGIHFAGVLLRKLFVYLFLGLIGGLIGLATSIYSFVGIVLLLYNYLVKK